MSDSDPSDSENPEPAAPRKLIERLALIRRETVLVPPEIDQAIIREGRKHLGKISAARRRNRFRIGLAAAALLALTLLLTQFLPLSQTAKKANRADVDHNGR